MVRRLAVLALVLVVAGCQFPSRKAQAAMPDLKALTGTHLGDMNVACDIEGKQVILRMSTYLNKSEEPGYRAVYLGSSPETMESTPTAIAEYNADAEFVAAYFDYDLDGLVDDKFTSYEAMLEAMDPSACGIVAYILAKRAAAN